MAQAAWIAMPTVTVVESARGNLTGSTSWSTSPTTASASARPTNTTNAYIFCLLCGARRAAHAKFDFAYDAWLQHSENFFRAARNGDVRGRSNQTDAQWTDVGRYGARPGLPAR